MFVAVQCHVPPRTSALTRYPPTPDVLLRLAQGEAGNIRIVETGDRDRDAWIGPYLEELCGFPGGEYSDQTDASSRAYGELLAMPKPQAMNMFIDEVGLDDY